MEKDLIVNENLVDQTLASREALYGVFIETSASSQRLKAAMASEKWSRMKYDQREALEMIVHKIARILNGDPNYADSWIDIAGYAMLVANRLNKGDNNVVSTNSRETS